MEYLLFEKQDDIGILTVNRPDILNALNHAVLEELRDFLEHTARDNHITALIVTGAGNKAFIAGADIKEMQALSHTQMLDFCELGQQVTHLLENAHFMTVAAVNGYALGGGLEMALACDFIYASQNAKLGLPEVSLGIIPGFGGTQRLSRAVGTRIAKEMILTGKHVGADEAKAIGLVNQVCEPDHLLPACKATASRVAKHSPIAVQQGKHAVNFGYQLGIHEALEIERNMLAVCFATEERKVAMQAFLEKRKK